MEDNLKILKVESISATTNWIILKFQLAWPNTACQPKPIKSKLRQRLLLYSYNLCVCLSVCVPYQDKSSNVNVIFSATPGRILLKFET